MLTRPFCDIEMCDASLDCWGLYETASVDLDRFSTSGFGVVVRILGDDLGYDRITARNDCHHENPKDLDCMVLLREASKI